MTHPLDRHLRLDLWGVGFSDAAWEIESQTGVRILVYPPDLPKDRNNDNVYLVSGKVSLRTVLECLAVRYSFRYRVSENGTIELSKGYNWIGNEPVLKILRLDKIVKPGTPNEALRAMLAECVKPMAIALGEYSISVERYPTIDNAEAMRCSAVLPAVSADYLERIVRCLEGEPGDYPAPPRPELYARASQNASNWNELLSRPMLMPAGGDTRSILRDLANQANIAIILATAPGTRSQPLGDMSESPGFGIVTGVLATRYGLGQRVVLASGGVAFLPGMDGDMHIDTRSRELFWTGLATAGFDAGKAAEQAGGGQALAARIRREVYPEVWRDPSCAVVFSPATGRIAVIAPINTVAAVAEFLARNE